MITISTDRELAGAIFGLGLVVGIAVSTIGNYVSLLSS